MTRGRRVGFKMTPEMRAANKPRLRHGMSNTPTWRSWQAMLQRCTNQKNHKFPLYGGRGILVCAEWVIFENFLDDMGIRPDGTTLDRIDPEGHYEPGNCRWADKFVQRHNRRPSGVPCAKCGRTFKSALHFHTPHCQGVTS